MADKIEAGLYRRERAIMDAFREHKPTPAWVFAVAGKVS